MTRIALALLVLSPSVFAQGTGWKQVSYEREGQILRLKHPDGRVEEFELCGGADLGPDPDAAKISDKCKMPEGRVDGEGAWCLKLTSKCPSSTGTMMVVQTRALGAKEWIPRAQPCSAGGLTVDGLKPGADYEVRGRTLCNDGTVSAWTRVTDVATKELGAPALVLEEARPRSLIVSVRTDAACPAPEGLRSEVSYAKGGETPRTRK